MMDLKKIPAFTLCISAFFACNDNQKKDAVLSLIKWENDQLMKKWTRKLIKNGFANFNAATALRQKYRPAQNEND
jgi:hypothetical protein